MSFPKPSFTAVLDHYSTHPYRIHPCKMLESIGTESLHTCAVRMSEALVIANHLARSLEDISTKKDLLGKYGYQGNLCFHGIARGPSDLAGFLKTQWGPRPLSSCRP